MRAIGIELAGKEAILVAAEKEGEELSVIESKIKKVSFKDHTNAEEVKEMRDLLFSFFNEISPDRIGIIKRGESGQFAASPISFKIEGLIQLYERLNIDLVPLPTIKAFLKKYPLSISAKYNYQENSLALAYFLLK